MATIQGAQIPWQYVDFNDRQSRACCVVALCGLRCRAGTCKTTPSRRSARARLKGSATSEMCTSQKRGGCDVYSLRYAAAKPVCGVNGPRWRCAHARALLARTRDRRPLSPRTGVPFTHDSPSCSRRPPCLPTYALQLPGQQQPSGTPRGPVQQQPQAQQGPPKRQQD